MIKTINKKFNIFYEENILLIHIIAQFLLFISYSFIYGSKSISIIDSLIISTSFVICYFSFLLVAYVTKNSLINKIAFLTLIISVYIIIHEKIYELSKLEIYFSTFLIFYYLETMIGFLTLNLIKIKMYRNVIAIFTMLNIIFHISNNQYDFLLHGVIWILISIYPILFIVINIKKVIKYGRKVLPSIILIILLQIIFIVSIFFIDIPGRDTNNYDVIFYIIIIELIYFTYILRIYNHKLKLNNLFNIKKVLFLLFILLILLFLLVNQIHMIHILIILLFSLIFQHELNVYLYFTNYDSENLFRDNSIKELIRLEEIEKLQREKTSAYLHDEILQDLLIVKKDLGDREFIKEENISLVLIDKIINSIRNQINLQETKLDDRISLGDNYFNLINDIKNKYKDYNVLIDFECDDKFFVSKPFDIIIYRILHELVTNIFKHSKGYYSKISLDIVEEKLKLIVENFGDYLEEKNSKNNSAGLKIVKGEVEKYDGTFKLIYLDNDASEYENSESVVQIEVTIPIKRGEIYENFISGRP